MGIVLSRIFAEEVLRSRGKKKKRMCVFACARNQNIHIHIYIYAIKCKRELARKDFERWSEIDREEWGDTRTNNVLPVENHPK